MRWFGTNTDITEKLEAEENLRRYSSDLEVSNKELEAFAYSVSHDLRAPLRTLDGFSKAVMEDYEDKLDNTGKDYLRRIRDAAKHMDQITRDMLTLSRVIRSDLRMDDVNLSNLVSTIANELSEKAPSRKVEFIISPDVIARGDASLLQMALFNLMENAWKFTAKTTEARIEFGTMVKDDERIYFVSDNGVGFDMRYVDKLFQPFQRLHTDAEYPGTGIGLAIVQRVIRRHGGRILAESQEGKGTTIYFTLG
jgi:light-regulated signal transduction histidine kinase (bacteriophytochrome)